MKIPDPFRNSHSEICCLIALITIIYHFPYGVGSDECWKSFRSCTDSSATGLTIAEIAYETGFNDPDYFARSFKKAFELTPSDFRKQT
ncbi:MAG: AraC family transcriptional regulator [Saprospiraceae bacterium]|nr:AraC family transcriptional regulator [Saprospiraceae bacterium]